MRLYRPSPILVFAIGIAAGAGGFAGWVKCGGDIPITPVSPPVEVQHIAIGLSRSSNYIESDDPKYPAGYSGPEELRFTGNVDQDRLNQYVIARWKGAGATLCLASTEVRQYVLKRENEFCCLKCGEVNPGTAERGYPPDGCHKCCPQYHGFRDRLPTPDSEPDKPPSSVDSGGMWVTGVGN